jgi:hypothetical protein
MGSSFNYQEKRSYIFYHVGHGEHGEEQETGYFFCVYLFSVYPVLSVV